MQLNYILDVKYFFEIFSFVYAYEDSKFYMHEYACIC